MSRGPLTPRQARGALSLSKGRPAKRARGVDERKVNERLREVAEKRARLRIDFFRVETDVVRAREEGLHQHARLVCAADVGERRHEPERTVEKTPFPARHAIVGMIAIDEVAMA